MATAKTKIEVRPNWLCKLTVKIARISRRFGFAIPHRLVTAITNRNWLMRVNDGEWKSIRIDNRGRVLT